MNSLRAALAGLFAAAVALAGVVVALVAMSDHEPDKVLRAGLGAAIGLSFCGAGAYAWSRRPNNRFGALMTAVGFAWFFSGLTEANDPALYTLGTYLAPLYLVLTGHMLLAFPSGRLETKTHRTIIALAYVDVLLVVAPFYLLGGDIDGPAHAPRNAWALTHAADSARVFRTLGELVAAALVLWLGMSLLRKRRRASAPQRRAMAPVLWTGLVFVVSLGAAMVHDLLTDGGSVDGATNVVTLVALTALPWAFVVGLVRGRYTSVGAVSALIERLTADAGGEPDLRAALAEALGDRELRLAYWSRASERYVDAQGHPEELPQPGTPGCTVTEIDDRDGVRIAAIVHDVALLEEPGVVRAAGAAAALALHNERLEAELKARVEELQISRRKVIEVGMAERRALERNLHDGAQQRLIAVSLQLGLARTKLRADPEISERILDGARRELASALEELRELARGIHPAILTDRGLGPALESLAGRAPVPVEVEAVPPSRMPMPVEAVAYFVVAESLTNVARYADAEHAVVRVVRDNGFAVVEIEDNGVGGADPSVGSGLRGLADRLAALDGRLEVVSPLGGGTLVRARIPCG